MPPEPDRGDLRRCAGQQLAGARRQATSGICSRSRATASSATINPQNSNIAYITSYPWSGYPSLAALDERNLFGNVPDRSPGPGSGVANGDRVNWVTPYLLDPTNPSRICTSARSGCTARLNNGTSWTAQGPNGHDRRQRDGVLALDINRKNPGSSSSPARRRAACGARRTAANQLGRDHLGPSRRGRSVNDVASDPTNPERVCSPSSAVSTRRTSGSGMTGRDVDRARHGATQRAGQHRADDLRQRPDGRYGYRVCFAAWTAV